MKLHHTVNHIPVDEIAKSIEANGLIPQVADVYTDLVPEGIRHLPIIWLAEGVWQSYELPVFEVDTEDLDSTKLYPVVFTHGADNYLHWWIYQGKIAAKRLTRIVKEWEK